MTNKFKLFLIFLIILALALAGYLYYDYQQKKSEVIFFDVGQGDSALINLHGDNEILIDGGPDKTVLAKLGKYMSFYNRSLELVILTHPHADHLIGLVSLFDRYDIKKIMLTGVIYNESAYQVFLEKIKAKDIEIIYPQDFNQLELASDVFLNIIYPKKNIASTNFADLNDSSIVVKLDTPDQDFLFTGDISTDIEGQILASSSPDLLDADILKVAHHGSITSSGEDFLQAVSPSSAVISVGENNFGHPSLRVIKRLERAGAEVFQTDQSGDIIFKIR